MPIVSETDYYCRPRSFYAVSKFACENYIKLLCNKYKIDWVILRLFNVYGPGQDMTRMTKA